MKMSAESRRPSSTSAFRWSTTRSSRFVLVLDGSPARTIEIYTLATPCSVDADCGSAQCQDGLCCATACGTCEACDTPEDPGHCAPVEGREDADTCSGDMTCDDDGSCVPG